MKTFELGQLYGAFTLIVATMRQHLRTLVLRLRTGVFESICLDV